MAQKTARVSSFSNRESPYQCRFDWPDRTSMQCGDSGIVLEPGEMENALVDSDKAVDVVAEVIGIKTGHRRTAFFEAFVRNPWTFIRGEGATIEEAEEHCWNQLQRVFACPGPNGHEFEARGYENGLGFCKWCGLSKSHSIKPTHACQVCNEPTWHFKDANGNYWCEDHSDQVPESCLSELDLKFRQMAKRMEEFNKPMMMQAGITTYHHYGVYPGAAFKSLAEVRAAVAEAREAARQDAAENDAFAESFERETFVSTADKRSQQCEPFPGAEAHPWGGTVSEIKTIIDDILTRHPEADVICIEGGFDGADSKEAYQADDYTPWISDFSVVVWRRPAEEQ